MQGVKTCCAFASMTYVFYDFTLRVHPIALSTLYHFGREKGAIVITVNQIRQQVNSIDERLNRVESKVDNMQSPLNTVEHRVIDLTDQHKLGIRQTSAEIGELRHSINHIKSKVGLEVF